MRSRLLRVLLPVLAGIVAAVPFAAAQSIGSTASFSVSEDPQYPAPYSSVTLTPLSSSLDLSNATVDASVNGKKVYSGNAQPFTVSVGAAGSRTSVEVVVTSAGTTYRQTLVIRPEDVALVAEPLSSAPPLYPGSPLVPLGGEVRLAAIAHIVSAAGNALDPVALSYAWTIDGTRDASASGIGKDAVIVTSPLEYRSRTVSVVVESSSGSYVGGATLTLEAQEPVVRIYENDPLLGVRFGQALSGPYAIPGAEASFYGAAYSFPTTGAAPALEWYLNGTTVQTGDVVTLRPTGSGAGNALLSFDAAAGVTARATAQLSLTFGSTPSSNSIFGL